ncbi:hypothetical protein [Shinella sp.]|uniref:hypothetical protein n=1 Tax=Shinella sp. TaxID=1870904 RepID=UPI0029AC67DB|nr:hypothetical protein [Shinella sp.]MDX3977838.1 hypothetical protein [Shinella sp.]
MNGNGKGSGPQQQGNPKTQEGQGRPKGRADAGFAGQEQRKRDKKEMNGAGESRLRSFRASIACRATGSAVLVCLLKTSADWRFVKSPVKERR